LPSHFSSRCPPLPSANPGARSIISRPTSKCLANFGERADFSPDNKRIGFMDKIFGDAFDGLTVIRHMSVENDYKTHQMQMSSN
jgi:hypothetical protein